MLFQTRQKILFIGDSITDAGRRNTTPPFGTGYVNMVRCALLARYPELLLSFVNQGISGNCVGDLAARWDTDVLAERPDWVSLMIGINDLWPAFGSPYQCRKALPPMDYKATLHQLVNVTRERIGAHVILLTPYVIEPNQQDPFRAGVDAFGAAVAEIGQTEEAHVVDTQAAFDAVLAHSDAGAWSADRVHLEEPSHMVIALAFLRCVGFDLGRRS